MESIFSIATTVMTGLRRDIRVRLAAGAGASVLLSAGVLGLGGSFTPAFLFASSTPQQAGEAQLASVPEASIIFPAADKSEGFLVDRSTSTVFQVIQSLPKAERFEMMLYNSGADETLKRAGTYTVFVPASSKFDYLPKGYIAKLSRTAANNLALSHMVARALPLEEALSGRVLTLGNTSVSFEVETGGESATVGGADVLKVYKASNGYVYIIDKVLVDAN
jgi:uncharacterized surface protein with fasciclin (FAS1) repeats